MMKRQKFVLYWAGTLFLAFGLMYLLFPVFMIELSGMQIPTASSKVDAWAIYAGIQLGFASYLFICSRDNRLIPSAILSLVCVLSSIVIVRIAGMLYYQCFDQYNLSALVFELPSALLSIWAYCDDRMSKP